MSLDARSETMQKIKTVRISIISISPNNAFKGTLAASTSGNTAIYKTGEMTLYI